MHKIESGIPISEKIEEPRKNWGYWTELAQKMKPGDSVKVSRKEQAETLTRALRDRGCSCLYRSLPDGDYRVWRKP